MGNDPRVERALTPPSVTPEQTPLVDAQDFAAQSLPFRPVDTSSRLPAEMRALLPRLEEDPANPTQISASIDAVDTLGRLAQSYKGDRADLKDAAAALRHLCGETNNLDLKPAIFAALERIGLVEPETLRMLRAESHGDYPKVNALARHAFLAIASQRADVHTSAA